MRTLRVVCRVAAVAVAAAALPVAPAPAQQVTRYSLQGGCFSLTGPGIPAGERVRMQATGLGSYLLYRPDRTFLASQQGGGAAPAADPSPAADWKVDEGQGGSFTLTPKSGGAAIAGARFAAADGCPVYPEADLDASGRPKPNTTSYGRVGGLVEGHMHWMTYEYFGKRFHCGKPWDAYGIPYALPDCSDIEGPQGTAAPFQNFLNYGNPAQPHDTTGWPKLTSWSKDNLTYEGTYWRWVERAYLGGLRLMVMGINENRVLCELQASRETNCNEMDTVRRGLKAIRELQDYVDAQAGGPGKGFFQIVTNPFDARRVINQGRMAVVLEIEISEPFDCSNIEQPTCDQAQVDRQLDEVYRSGVRSMLLLNKFDNPLVGVRFDSGPVGLLINSGNKVSAGSYWSARTCTGKLADNEIFQPSPQVAAGANSLLAQIGLTNAAPAYPPAPHCNTRGLTTLGKHVVNRMMDLNMIVNPDHMSQAGVSDTLSLLEARDYSGVISPHGWMDPGNWPRLWKLGGIAFPGHSAADEYVKDWERYRPKQTPYAFGWGYGADLGGLSGQPSPSADGKSITYPFKSYDGSVTFERQKTGERTFDYTKEGVSNYGLYPDWFEDLRRIGGPKLAGDMWRGAEAYIEMWERASGIPARGCDNLELAITSRGRGGVHLGSDWQTALRKGGQPQQRSRAWSWCVRGKGNARAADVAVFTKAGRVQLYGSTARERRTGAGRIGSRARGRGIRVVRRTRTGALWRVVRGGRIVAAGVATRGLARRPKALRAAIARVRRAKATQAPRRFVPSAAQAQAASAPSGRPLAGTADQRLNASLVALGSRHVPAQ